LTAADFYYRYAIFQQGKFHKWEDPSDGSEGGMEEREASPPHCLSVRQLQDGETYTVQDICGQVDQQRIQVYHAHPEYQGAATLLVNHNAANDSAMGLSTPTTTTLRKTTSGNAMIKAKQKTTNAVHLNDTDGLVVVSLFLPVIVRALDGQWTADWDYEMLLSMQTHMRVVRVGVVKQAIPMDQRPAVEECLAKLHCVPVWLDPGQFAEMYNGFCKGVLWPVLHNVTSVYSERPEDNDDMGGGSGGHHKLNRPDHHQFSEYSLDDVEQGPIHGGRGKEAVLWGAYNDVNRQFAARVVQCFNEGDLVWIHGFHLLILPSYLTRRLPMAKVGIFLHTPFPSSEIFRTLWCREDLLRGMLNADQVGFHLFEYARHFLTSCRRLLGLNYGMIADSSGGHSLCIDSAGRNVAVTSIHAGVEPPVLKQFLDHPSTIEKVHQIRSQHPQKLIACSIDRLESLKGIPLKLLGLERFLTRCPEWVGKIVLIQVGIRALERHDDSKQTEEEVNMLTQKINSQWPGTVQLSVVNDNEVPLQQRMALLRAADVVVVTSIRDGLNLLPLEFTIAHQDALTEAGRKDGRKRGMCILSEFSSSTRVMRGALHINPYKISEIANAFHLAVIMSDEERLRRLTIASEFVTRVTTQRWALAVMLDLKGVHKNFVPGQFAGAGLGLGYHLLGMDSGFRSLDFASVSKAYRSSKARLILLDYGGTIVNNDNVRDILLNVSD